MRCRKTTGFRSSEQKVNSGSLAHTRSLSSKAFKVDQSNDRKLSGFGLKVNLLRTPIGTFGLQ